MIHENQVEILELTDEAMEAVAGGAEHDGCYYEYEYNYNYGIKIKDSQIVFDLKKGDVNFNFYGDKYDL